MHWTFPPLLAKVVMSLVFWLIGNPAVDLRPENGATMVVVAGAPPRFMLVTAAVEDTMDAISLILIRYYFFKYYAVLDEEGFDSLFCLSIYNPTFTHLLHSLSFPIQRSCIASLPNPLAVGSFLRSCAQRFMATYLYGVESLIIFISA